VRARVRLAAHDSKRTITRNLQRVAVAWPVAAPSRNTLKKLHRFFSADAKQ
jgi:hypothetical protein